MSAYSLSDVSLGCNFNANLLKTIKHAVEATKIMSNPTKPYMILIYNEDALWASVEGKEHTHESFETTKTK